MYEEFQSDAAALAAFLRVVREAAEARRSFRARCACAFAAALDSTVVAAAGSTPVFLGALDCRAVVAGDDRRDRSGAGGRVWLLPEDDQRARLWMAAQCDEERRARLDHALDFEDDAAFRGLSVDAARARLADRCRAGMVWVQRAPSGGLERVLINWAEGAVMEPTRSLEEEVARALRRAARGFPGDQPYSR